MLAVNNKSDYTIGVRSICLALLMLIAIAVASNAAAPSKDIRKACANEIELFCKGETGRTLIRCLDKYSGSATTTCQAQLRDRGSKGAAAPVWGSLAKIEGAPEAIEVNASSATGPSIYGFDLSVDPKEVYYNVNGNDSKSIISGMNSSGLLDGVDGTKGSANTGYSIGLEYSRSIGSAGCAMASAHVHLTVTQHLPRWEPPPSADQGLIAWWKMVSSVIKAHENGHKDIDFKTGQNILKYIQALPPMPSCDDLDQAVHGALQRGTVESTQQNVAYDAENNHGQKQFEQAMKEFQEGRKTRSSIP